MANVSETNIDTLKQDDKNFNKGTKRGEQMMRKSIGELGLGRSVLLDKNNNIIAGNKTQDMAKQLGCKDVIVVETDGSKLVAVKRTDIDLHSKKGREMALADNKTAQENIDLDYVKMREELDKQTLEKYNVHGPLKSQTEMLSKLEYTSCYYEPKNKPELRLEDCIDLTKFNEKVKALDEYDLTPKQKEILKWFAYRFIKIDFEGVANYYAFNASEEEKKAIERLRLVLIDDGWGGYIEDGMLKILNAELEDEMKEEGV
jgi:hypothetical protein